jgi:AhpD family alkylhydroperoxidase
MTDDQHHRQVLENLLPQHRALRQQIPDVYKGFAALSSAAFTEGALSRKVKELIALAIGVVEGCDGCIAAHAKGAADAGATPQEAAEAIGVTFLMHGGPATIHGARAYTAFCEFADGTAAQPT